MKRIYFIILSLFINISFGQAIITYKVELDSMNELYQKNRNKSYILATKHSNKLNFILKYDGNDANYYMEDIMASENAYGIKQAIATTHGFKFLYITKGVSYFEPMSYSGNKNQYIIADSINKNWKITGESKIIKGFECYKAIGEIKITEPEKGEVLQIKKKPKVVTAWFCPKIPIPLGPKGFGGLPGLILSLSYDKFNISVDHINLKPKKKIKIKKIEGTNLISEANYMKIMIEKKLEELKANGINIDKM